MSTNKWINLTIDRRGSIFIPMDIKRLSGVEPGKILSMRLVGEVMLLVPFDYFIQAGVAGKTDAQHDAVAAMALNESWNNPKLAVSPPVVALEAASPVSNSKTVPHLRQHVEVNRKGFIPTPNEIKEALGLEIGDKVMIEVQVKDDNRPVIVLEPMNGASRSLADHLEEKRQQYEQAQALEAKVAALQKAKKELFQEIHELTARRDVISRGIATDLQKQRASEGPVNNFAAHLAGVAKPRGVIDLASVTAEKKPASMSEVLAKMPKSDQPIIHERKLDVIVTVPDHSVVGARLNLVAPLQEANTEAVRDQPPTDIPLQEGHRWKKDAFFGWLQVPTDE